MRYSNNDIINNKDNILLYKSKIYPVIPLSENDVYVITTIGDRLDTLADLYYKDARLWWIISMVNSNIDQGNLNISPGTQLRIPVNVSYVLDIFNKANNLR